MDNSVYINATVCCSFLIVTISALKRRNSFEIEIEHKTLAQKHQNLSLNVQIPIVKIINGTNMVVSIVNNWLSKVFKF